MLDFLSCILLKKCTDEIKRNKIIESNKIIETNKK